MNKTGTYRRVVRAVAAALAVCFLLSLCQLQAECEGIGDRVLRLHILANSDSEADQALKLMVRDAILEKTAGLFAGAQSEQQAQQQAQKALPDILAVAEQTLREAGSSDGVTGGLCRMYFTARQYDNVTLPAGEYTALRLTIGEGKGHNWWCVLFPPLCVASAESRPLSDVLDAEQQDIVQQPQQYEIRLKILDWLTGKG